MANIHGLRHVERRPAAPRGRFWHAVLRSPRSRAILGLALATAVLLAGLSATGKLRSSTGRAPVVSRALGPQDPGFTLDRRWDALTRVSISTKGLHVRHAGVSVALTAAGAGSAGWTSHRFGVDRPTPFGRESIVVAAPRTEEYLTVTRHVGSRTWQWQLASGLSRPQLEPDGSISFVRAGRQAGVRVLPPLVFAADGRDITPAGAHWTLERSGSATTLALRLDDASFPTPYVIDPIAIVGSPGGTGQTKTGSPLAITMPTGVAAGNLLLASVSLRDATATLTPPAGWTLLTSIPTSGATSKQLVYTRVAAAGEPASYSWSWTGGAGASDSSGVILAYSGIWSGAGSNVDTSTTATANATTTASTAAGTAAFTQDMILAFYGTAGSSAFTAPAGMTALATITSTSGAPTSRSSSGSFQVIQAASGAIAAKSSTITSADNTAVMVAIRPAAAAASATNSTLTASPASVLADNSTSSTVTATIKDANGNPLPGKTVTLAKGSGSSTITTVSGTTDAAGVATFTVKDAAVESTVYTATDTTDAVTITQTATVNFTAGPATQTVFTTSPANTNGGTAFAAQPVVKVEDAFGHVITTDNTTAVTLAIGTNPSAGTLSGCTTNPITVTAGVATFAGCKINKSGVGYTLTTTNVAGLTNGVSSAFNITVGAATQVTLTTSGSTAGGGSRTLTATIQDAGGNTVTTDNTTQVTFNKNSGTGTASFPAAATAVSGVATATATNLLIGTMVVGATTSPVLTVNVAASYTIVVGAASQVTITTAGSTAGGGSRTLTGTVQDAGGNTVTTDNTTQVTFNKNSGTGTASFPAAATAVSGVATATATNGLAGTLVVGATTSPVLTVNNAASYTIVLGAASQLVFTTSPGNTNGGAAFAAQPVVKVEDGGGNVVTTNNTAVVTLTIGTNPSAGTLSGCTTNPITVTSGVATFAGCKIDKAGTGYTLTTTNASGFANGSSSAFNITVGAASQVTLTTSGSTAGGGSRTLTATIQDAGGNTVTTDNSTQVTFNKASGTGTASFPAAVTASSGVATATATNQLIGTMVVGATTSPVLTVNNASSYTIVLGAASQTVFTTSPGNTNGGTAFAAQPVVKVEDAGGNVITTDNATQVTLTIGTNPAAGTLSGCTTNPITVASGVATFAACKINKAGNGYTLTTTNGAGLTNGVSSAFNITVGAATQVTLTTSGSTAGGGSRTLTATIQDAGGNTVTTDNTTQVTFNKNSGTGTASFPAAATASSGVATGTATNLLTGTMVVGATTSPVLTVNNASSYTIVAGPASQVAITTAGSTAGGGSRTLTATIQDAGGNTVTTDNSTQVTFNKASGTGTAAFPAAATAVNGVATATATNQLIGTMVVGATTSPVLTVNNAASYTIVLGAASQTVFTASPGNTGGGTSFAAQPVVKVEDAGGNVITTDNTTAVTLTIGTNPAGGTLSGCTTNPITVASGVATFAGCKINTAGTGYTLTTTNTAALANGVSSSFNITVGAATQVTLTTSGSTSGGGSRTLTATVQDAGGNTVTTDNTTQVTFNKASGTGTAAFPAA
ncbi:MAG: trimeric autotransporter adhesin, partial [Frankiaceae bacterium]|nr:trimeric autotransporter adhesin [Frankiaceae bacterium]